MIHHIVMWTLKETAEGKSKAENALLIKEKLEHLGEIIPQIESIHVGINIENKYSNFDLVLDSYFNSMDDLMAYQVHPKHNEVADFIGKVREERSCVDYEI